MDRIVIVLQKTIGGPPQVFLQESATLDSDVPAVLTGFDLAQLMGKIDAQPLPANSVRDVGSQLLDLLALHPTIKTEVLPKLDVAMAGERPIYLVVRDPELEKLPWEALHAPNAGFVCGEKRWPLARARSVANSVSEASFLPPLKLMVILGASGTDALTRIPSDDEWDSIYRGVERSNFNVQLHVMVCQEELKDKIDAEAQPWITTALLTDSGQLFEDIASFSPHVLHFFCHGVSTPVPALHVASTIDWELKQAGSIQLESGQLFDRAGLKGKTWLVTLNCCESAQQGGTGSRSIPFASSLVNAGVPAVVGMRERFEASLAHAFCGHFYNGLLNDLKERLETAAAGGTKEVRWACGLYAARQSICEELAKELAGGAEERTFSAIAASAKEWTIPVLYSRLQDFSLRILPDVDGSHPVIRPAVAPPPPVAPAVGELTLEDIRRLSDERKELLALREEFKARARVVQTIDARLKEIDNELS